jgi:hypothetical protein
MVSGAPAHPSTRVPMVPEAPARPRAYATGTVHRSTDGTVRRSTAGTDRRSTTGNLTGGGGAPTSGHTVGVGRALGNPCSLNITSPLKS